MASKTPYDGPTYTFVPNKAMDDLNQKGASISDRMVYVVLCRFYNMEENKCWPSLNTIAKLSGCSQRNVQRSVSFLASCGMILRIKTKQANSVYENNSYLLPHMVSFQLEKLMEEKKSAKVSRKIKSLKDLQQFILQSIQESLGRDTMSLRRDNKSPGRDKKAQGKDTGSGTVETPSPANNTTINTTINITKNVNDEKSVHNRQLSIASSQHISAIDALIRIKHEGLVQKLAEDLNDHKSIPFFRRLVSKFINHEDSIYKCLSLTQETDEITGINKSRGAVFTDHIKREAMQLGIEL